MKASRGKCPAGQCGQGTPLKFRGFHGRALNPALVAFFASECGGEKENLL